ncbi:AzlC family ABC transporter permease [Aeromonas cavernicola]|uniref:Branched-chain amino acid ABC transporter permease n=1 Tax=Aeromonas cavernicola TaxID=1006623 RepID=A0A2H9U9Q0_9GAMM|nr:AzlC family ABC transporter permease [Aeromonas cavernicola]PJG60753.1 branched-chain amino acid ABC transporter permease [Aeromonas cavernicola]
MTTSPFPRLCQGALAMLPLSVAVLPWGLLAGSLAIDNGLSPLEGQAMSAILFAGAAQLAAIGLIKGGAGLLTLLLTTLFITSRHLLYSLAMRPAISPLPLHWRLGLGFLLTDELFALCGQQPAAQFDRWYALGAGLSFYLAWNLATLLGIVAGSQLPWLADLGLEFVVAATFIALIVPTVRHRGVLACIATALCLSVLLTALQIPGAMMLASAAAMIVGYLCEPTAATPSAAASDATSPADTPPSSPRSNLETPT